MRLAYLGLAADHPEVNLDQEPNARFLDFGDSALIFELLFWSSKMWIIEKIKSDIRFEIDKRFRAEGITIPFPQRDLHIKSGNI